MNKINRMKRSFQKKIKRRFKGYPVATIALYGPDNKLATKIAVGIITHESADPVMIRWHSETDIRKNDAIMHEIYDYIAQQNDIRSIVMTDRIIGCPHEEGVDYNEGEACPYCPYWACRDRWADGAVH